MAFKSKKRKQIEERLAGFVSTTLSDAIDMLRELASKKFSETVEFCVKLGVDPRHADQIVKGSCALPSGLGRNVRVAVFAGPAFKQQAIDAGADKVGADDLVQEIMAGKIDFDRCIATPDMMPLVGRLAKILGPRGLMPNPKTGTVTTDVANVVSSIKAGTIEFKCDKAGIVHVPAGKISFTNEQLIVNLQAIFNSILKSRPTGSKGTYIQGAYLTSTQGCSFPVSAKEFQTVA